MHTSRSTTAAARVPVLFTLLLGLTMILTACGGGAGDYTGAYSGSSGYTTLVLSKDGTAEYKVGDHRTGNGDVAWSGTEVGTWSVTDDILTVQDIGLNYEIYADVSSFDGTLFFRADSGRWNDELYTRH